ncbi:MAG: F0F1 ATP synthase subunit alpha [Candidatus Omnitrophica bacterium]|nr:F0F1 ATP synthase subunit alpha [Candidatus Omnitrophota bacterium]
MSSEKEDMDKPQTGFDVREVGYVESVRQFVVIAKGLPFCMNGQIVEFANGTLGLVIGFTEEDIQVLVLGDVADISAGDEIYNKGKSLDLPVGDAFVGRIVNGLCMPQDGLGPIEANDSFPVFRVAPGVMERQPVDKTFETGTLILDAIIPTAKGQRQLLIGDRQTGKTTVAMDAILNQKGRDVICIYCIIGKPYSSLVKVVDLLKEHDALKYTIIVSGVASLSTGEQYLAPYTASMLGEYFMYNGKDVFVVFDDLTKHAWVYRQLSLLLERAPGREAYPGDIFYIHSQLMERAGYLSKERGNGTMTYFPIVEILQGDLTGYIPTNIVSMTDGQLYFATELFKKGFMPAIDFGLSVSRIGNKAQWNAMRSVSKTLRLDYIQYRELLRVTQMQSGRISQDAQDKIKRGDAINALINQYRNQPVLMEAQIVYLNALNLGLLDNLSKEQILQFREDICPYITKIHPSFFSELRTAKEMSTEMSEKLESCLKDYIAGKIK